MRRTPDDTEVRRTRLERFPLGDVEGNPGEVRGPGRRRTAGPTPGGGGAGRPQCEKGPDTAASRETKVEGAHRTAHGATRMTVSGVHDNVWAATVVASLLLSAFRARGSALELPGSGATVSMAGPTGSPPQCFFRFTTTTPISKRVLGRSVNPKVGGDCACLFRCGHDAG